MDFLDKNHLINNYLGRFWLFYLIFWLGDLQSLPQKLLMPWYFSWLPPRERMIPWLSQLRKKIYSNVIRQTHGQNKQTIILAVTSHGHTQSFSLTHKNLFLSACHSLFLFLLCMSLSCSFPLSLGH